MKQSCLTWQSMLHFELVLFQNIFLEVCFHFLGALGKLMICFVSYGGFVNNEVFWSILLKTSCMVWCGFIVMMKINLFQTWKSFEIKIYEVNKVRKREINKHCKDWRVKPPVVLLELLSCCKPIHKALNKCWAWVTQAVGRQRSNAHGILMIVLFCSQKLTKHNFSKPSCKQSKSNIPSEQWIC